MKDVKLIRNIGLFGHGKCGKTSLAEALLFTAGKINRLGKVDEGSACMDWEPEEIKRQTSITSSFNHFDWQKHTVFLTDTPGDENFSNDTHASAQIVDSAIFIVGAVLGVKYQTEKIAQYLRERNLPTLLYITKMDRERANFTKVVDEIKERLPMPPVVLQLPMGAEENFRGVVDIVRQKAFLFTDNHNGQVKETAIPADLAAEAGQLRATLMELVAETDDELIEKFLEEGELSPEELQSGLKKAVHAGQLCPVLAGAATRNLGTTLLLDAIAELLPSPLDTPPRVGTDPKTKKFIERPPTNEAPFSALVFKTMADPYAGRLSIFRVFSGELHSDSCLNATKETMEKFGQLLLLEGKESTPVSTLLPGMIAAVAKLKETVTGDTLCAANAPIVYEAIPPLPPVIAFAVTATNKKDEEKLFASLTKMLEEDPTLHLRHEATTNEVLLSGVGLIHLQIVGEKIKRKFGIEMTLKTPRIPYRETLRGKARVQGKHKKQSGGRGQFADSWLEIEPLPGGGFLFEDKIVGGVIPKQYIPAIEKGVQEAMAGGVLAGYPVVDVKVAVVDGSFHNVDSSEMAFKISGSLAFKKGALEAKPVLLEPLMNMTIWLPQECVGDVIAGINSRRGKVMGMDAINHHEVITAQVPMAEILEYAPDLTSITGGRGTFSTEFSHYEEVPAHLAEKIIAEAKTHQKESHD